MTNDLSDENRALIMEALGQTYWEIDDSWTWLSMAEERDLNSLMNAARAHEAAKTNHGSTPPSETVE